MISSPDESATIIGPKMPILGNRGDFSPAHRKPAYRSQKGLPCLTRGSQNDGRKLARQRKWKDVASPAALSRASPARDKLAGSSARVMFFPLRIYTLSSPLKFENLSNHDTAGKLQTVTVLVTTSVTSSLNTSL